MKFFLFHRPLRPSRVVAQMIPDLGQKVAQRNSCCCCVLQPQVSAISHSVLLVQECNSRGQGNEDTVACHTAHRDQTGRLSMIVS